MLLQRFMHFFGTFSDKKKNSQKLRWQCFGRKNLILLTFFVSFLWLELKTIYHSVYIKGKGTEEILAELNRFRSDKQVVNQVRGKLRVSVSRRRSISVMIGLEGSPLGNAEIFGLVFGEGGELDAEMLQVGFGDFLVELLGQHVDADLVFAGFGPEFDLGQDLVGERVAHDEGGMTHSAAEIDETAFGEQDDVFAVFEGVAIDLGLDVVLLGVLVQPGGVYLAVEMSDVADDGVFEHLLEVVAFDDAGAAGGGDEDARLLDGFVHRRHFEPFHGGLEGVDGIDLGDQDAGAERAQGLGAAFADVSVSGDGGDFAGDHDVGGALDAVDQRLAAAVEVVELGLGHRVVDVDGGDHEFALLVQLVKIVDAGGGFFGAALDAGQEVGVLGVDEVGQVTPVVEDHVEGLAVREEDGLLDAPKVLFVGHPLPRVDGNARRRDGRSSVVLSGEDVTAGPGDVGAEFEKRFDEDGGLDGHVEAAGDAGALQRLGGAVLLTQHHQAGHLVLRHVQHFAAPFRLRDIRHLERKFLLRSHDYMRVLSELASRDIHTYISPTIRDVYAVWLFPGVENRPR